MIEQEGKLNCNKSKLVIRKKRITKKPDAEIQAFFGERESII